MGLGPNGTSLLPRVGLREKTPEEFEAWVRSQQEDRSAARALGQLKRREKASKVKVPKPRRHKHHCYCIPRHAEDEPLCCRCKGEKCVKPVKPKRSTKKQSAMATDSTAPG